MSGQRDCFSHGPGFPLVICHRGVPRAAIRVALVGNSHAAEWLPAVEQAAQHDHWQITTFLASRCALADLAQHFEPVAVSVACRNWVDATVRTIIGGRYDLVVMSNKMSVNALGYDTPGSAGPYRTGYERVLRRFHEAHVTVVGLRDTPLPRTELVPACLAAHPHDYQRCDGSVRSWLPEEPLVAAVAAIRDSRIRIVDLTEHFCRSGVCPAVVGRVVVYADASHITATYSRTVGPYLEPQLRAALGTR